MKKQTLVLLFVIFALIFISIYFAFQMNHPRIRQIQPIQNPAWSVCFSPEGGCTKNIVNALEQAKSSVLVQAYSFTSEPIANALIDAKKRGAKVDVILDRSQVRVKRGQVNHLVEAQIPVNIDAAHSIAHNKVMVIDHAVVITGSFNFTTDAALYNAENLLIITDTNLASQYAENWQEHKEHSKPYETWLSMDAVKQSRNKKRSEIKQF